MKKIFLSLVLGTSLIFCGYSQEKASGPIIKDFGKVFKVEHTDFTIDTSQEFKAVFDVMHTPAGHDTRNTYLETAARFLNMHAQAGIPQEQLKVALVIHNLAAKDVLSNAAYQKKYGADNPNAALIQALLAAGGQVLLCGQSAMARGIAKEELIEGVHLSLSAMTALIQLQNENYRLLKF